MGLLEERVEEEIGLVSTLTNTHKTTEDGNQVVYKATFSCMGLSFWGNYSSVDVMGKAVLTKLIPAQQPNAASVLRLVPFLANRKTKAWSVESPHSLSLTGGEYFGYRNAISKMLPAGFPKELLNELFLPLEQTMKDYAERAAKAAPCIIPDLIKCKYTPL